MIDDWQRDGSRHVFARCLPQSGILTNISAIQIPDQCLASGMLCSPVATSGQNSCTSATLFGLKALAEADQLSRGGSAYHIFESPTTYNSPSLDSTNPSFADSRTHRYGEWSEAQHDSLRTFDSYSPPKGVSRLQYICPTLYLLWLIAILGVISIEWYQRKRKFNEDSVHVWITRLPLLAGIVSSLFAIISAGLEPQRQIESYTQSRASSDFIELCSNSLNQEIDSAAAIQTFLTECNAAQNRMNADIGGIGIRISLYIS